MSPDPQEHVSIPRRDFLKKSVAGAGAISALGAAEAEVASAGQTGEPAAMTAAIPVAAPRRRPYNGPYQGEFNNRIAFPLGGIGAGMICLEGTGALSHFSLRHRPEVFNEPCIFAAVCIRNPDGGNIARVLEGPVPTWKLYGLPGAANGIGHRAYGLPRFRECSFLARFPFGEVTLSDPKLPVRATVTGWSPFEPNDADNASLPVAGLEYLLTNISDRPLECVYSFNSKNFMDGGGTAVRPIPQGFILWAEGAPDKPWERGGFCVRCPDPATVVNHAWFRGGWFDALTMAWKDIREGATPARPPITEGPPSPGASLYVPLKLAPGQSARVVIQLSWYVGASALREGEDKKSGTMPPDTPAYQAWYTARFPDLQAVADYWAANYAGLREASRRFSDCFYDSTLPPEVIEAVAANLTILKSPTVLRQHDGRLWAWEGCNDDRGCCYGSCTHVWNYAQALPHLFPALERTLRETEFQVNQNEEGRQVFRTFLPIRQPVYTFHPATDGQLGGIMKVCREWQISGDTAWLRKLWPQIRRSLDYCINAWDPKRKGYLEEPQHNTYDIEFWGPNGMLTSFYLGALKAACIMGQALGEEHGEYAALLEKGLKYTESELYNGEYFIQKIQVEGLQAEDPTKHPSFGGGYSPEAIELLRKEGPKYQYGNGCLSDGVLGSWMAAVCGVGQVLDPDKVRSHLAAVHKYNLKHDLAEAGHANPQRPTYACGSEGGLLLCTWPHGGELSLPFVYSNEVWTGIEYQAAAHMILMGLVDEGLEVVRICRDRYDGRIRNPFNEYECGHWYARAMASYALLQALSGASYNAVTGQMTLRPRIRGDFRCFISTAGGYGTVGVRDGRPFLEVRHGRIEVRDWQYEPAA